LKTTPVRVRVAGGGEKRKKFELIRQDITGGPGPREALRELKHVRDLLTTETRRTRRTADGAYR